MGKEDVKHTQTQKHSHKEREIEREILFSPEKEGSPAIWENVEGT